MRTFRGKNVEQIQSQREFSTKHNWTEGWLMFLINVFCTIFLTFIERFMKDEKFIFSNKKYVFCESLKGLWTTPVFKIPWINDTLLIVSQKGDYS